MARSVDKITRNKLIKSRYKEYRLQGYSANVSKALSQRSKTPTKQEIEQIKVQVNQREAKQQLIINKRYLVYRRLGYDTKTSQALSKRELNVDKLEISEKTGKLKRNATTKQYFEKDMHEWKQSQAINKHANKHRLDPQEPRLFINKRNDTNYTAFGMLTHDKRHRGETGKIVSIIKHENNITTDQAYYFYYVMLQSSMTYKQTQNQLLSNKEFEAYTKNKKG